MSVVQTPAIFVNGTEAASGARAFASDVTTGNMIAIPVVLFSTGGPPDVSSVTDTLGNTYTEVATVTFLAGDCRLSIFRAKNVVGGPCTVTVNVSPNAQITFVPIELGGRNTTEPADASNTATGTGTAPSLVVATVAAETDMIGLFSHDSTNRTLTSGSGYTPLGENEGGTATMPLHVEFQAFGTAGAKTVDGTIGTGSVGWAIVGAAFKAAVVGPSDKQNLVPRWPQSLRPAIFKPGVAR